MTNTQTDQVNPFKSVSLFVRDLWSEYFSPNTNGSDNADVGNTRNSHQSLRTKSRLKPSGSEVSKTSITEPAQDPAVVFFPTNQDSECMDGSTGGGFNTFGFIATMLAAYNLIGLISNNGNQNNDNNDNNNNDNNNNNQNVNEANTDTAGMNMGMVILPPLPPGRMLNITATNTEDKSMMELNRTRREIKVLKTEQDRWSWKQDFNIDNAMNTIELIKAWMRIVKSHSSVSDRHVRSECSLRSVCEANHAASLRGDAARNSAEVGTYIMMSYLPLQFPVLQEMAMAARVGRLLANGSSSHQLEVGLCGAVYRDCDLDTWTLVTLHDSGT